jgi:hypothetical protein
VNVVLAELLLVAAHPDFGQLFEDRRAAVHHDVVGRLLSAASF